MTERSTGEIPMIKGPIVVEEPLLPQRFIPLEEEECDHAQMVIGHEARLLIDHGVPEKMLNRVLDARSIPEMEEASQQALNSINKSRRKYPL